MNIKSYLRIAVSIFIGTLVGTILSVVASQPIPFIICAGVAIFVFDVGEVFMKDRNDIQQE